MVKVSALDSPSSDQVQRLGFLSGQIITPDNFDRMGAGEIEELFGIDRGPVK